MLQCSAEMRSWRAPVSDLFIPNLQSRWGSMAAHISWAPSPSEHWADTVHRPKILSRRNPKIRFSSFKPKLPENWHPPTTNPLTNRGIPTPPTYQANATYRRARFFRPPARSDLDPDHKINYHGRMSNRPLSGTLFASRRGLGLASAVATAKATRFQ